MTQKQKILNHIKTYGKITSIEAVYRYRITRLSARIYELRHNDGYPIANKHVYKKSNGQFIHYDEYYMEESA